MTYRDIKDVVSKFTSFKLDKQATAKLLFMDGRHFYIDKIIFEEDEDGLERPVFYIEQ